MSAKVFQNQKNQKNQNNTPQPPRSSPSHGFGFFGFFGFLEVFATFGGKPQENQKKQKNTPQPPRSSPSHGFVFFVFFGFLEVFATFGGKPQENQKKQKKHTPTPQTFSIPWVWFFWFSRGFCHFWWKALRKPKNTCITLYKLFNCSNLFHVFISCFSIHYLCLIYPFNHLMTWSGRWPPGAFNLIYLYNLRKMN